VHLAALAPLRRQPLLLLVAVMAAPCAAAATTNTADGMLGSRAVPRERGLRAFMLHVGQNLERLERGLLGEGSASSTVRDRPDRYAAAAAAGSSGSGSGAASSAAAASAGAAPLSPAATADLAAYRRRWSSFTGTPKNRSRCRGSARTLRTTQA